jgi:hypothetical protein
MQSNPSQSGRSYFMPISGDAVTTQLQSGEWKAYLFLSIFVIIGSGVLILSVYNLLKTKRLTKVAASSTGTVTDIHVQKGKNTTKYFPVVTFKDSGGRQFQFCSRFNENEIPPEFKRGEQVPVYYDPNNPETAEINAFKALWKNDIWLAVIGLAFAAAGGIAIYSEWSGVLKAKLENVPVIENRQ